MLIFRRILVGDQERVLMTIKGRFERILEPGEYRVWSLGRAIRTETYNVRQVVFQSEWSDFLLKNRRNEAERLFTIVETGDTQVAVVSMNGKRCTVIGPGSRVLYWRGPVEVSAQILDAGENPQIPAAMLPALTRLHSNLVVFATVEDGKTGLLFVDGTFVRELGPGFYGFWNAAASVRVDVTDLRLQNVEISGQEILTQDKVSIRVNVWAEYQVTDAVRARQTVKDSGEHLYRTLQLAVRQTLGKRTLEQILAEKTDIDESVAADVRREMQGIGVRVGAIALKDIVLPGDMREILNQVVTAEKQAQANLIRRREETAATRSLLNTARLMDENPLLVRMKELETLEKIAEKVNKITVNGGFDTLLQNLLTLKAPDKNQ